VTVQDRYDDVERWTASGCRSLTGPAESSGLGPPDGLVAALDVVARRISVASRAIGQPVVIDPLAEVAMRFHLAGLSRNGRTSCGGATRMLDSADGTVVLALPRDDDLELVPALVGSEVPAGRDAAWVAIAEWMAGRASEQIVERAVLLGLAAAVVGPTPAGASAADGVQVASLDRSCDRSLRRVGSRPPRVVDLGSLWAGPLCAQLLGLAGCEVIKVETVYRPDGVRSGPPAVHARLNAGKRSVAIDPRTTEGRRIVGGLLDAADVVIEASRPRALAAWGLGPERSSRPQVWVSITGHGYTGDGATRIGFGDDVAAAAGLVATGSGTAWFCADAIADPLTGMVAAAEALEALADGRAVHLDVSMVSVARQFAGRTVDVTRIATEATTVTSGVSFPSMQGVTASLGADTDDVVRAWLG
jgi:hypothetical protein